MEGHLPSGNMIPGSGGSFDLQTSMRIHPHPFNLHHHHNAQSARQQQGSMIHAAIPDNFPLRIATVQNCNRHNQTVSLAEFSKGERRKGAVSDEDEPSFTEEGHDTHGKSTSQWQRVKWNDTMVRLMITAVSYIGEDASMEYRGGSRRKYSNLQKKASGSLFRKLWPNGVISFHLNSSLFSCLLPGSLESTTVKQLPEYYAYEDDGSESASSSSSQEASEHGEVDHKVLISLTRACEVAFIKEIPR